MNPSDELDLIREQVRRIEFDLAATRQRLAAVEQRLAAAPSEPLLRSAAMAVPAAVMAPPAAVPPPLPPPLPPMPPPAPVEPLTPPVLPAPAVVGAPAREFAPEEPAVSVPSPWKVWLTQLQLWPPDGEGNAEVRLGAWWATRLGALLAVIGVVLFGVYVSVNTPPWVKFAELVAVAAGVTGAGLWLERRIPRFGVVVFSAGLALLYFCAFAGYALPAVKVIDGVFAAACWQLAAVGLLAGTAVYRRSPAIATLAVGLGYVTAIFSRGGGMVDFALATAGLLAVASVWFHRRLRWEAPSVLAMPGTYAVYALVMQGTWWQGAPPSPVWSWGLLGFFLALFFVRDWRRGAAVTVAPTWGERWFQGVNAGLALLLGVALALVSHREQLAWFYFGAALVMAVLAAVRRRQVEADAVSSVLMTKAAGALTLGMIEALDGRTTAIALLVQAWVLAFTARRLISPVLAVVAAVVACVSVAIFLQTSGDSVPVVSPGAAAAWLFVAGLAALALEVTRTWLEGAARHALAGVGLAVALAAAVVTAMAWEPASGRAVWMMVMALAFAGVACVPGWRLAGVAGGGLLLGAHGVLWLDALIGTGGSALVLRATAVLAPTAVLAWWLTGSGAARTPERHRDAVYGAGVGAWVLLPVGVVLVIFSGADPMLNLVYALGFAGAVAALAVIRIGRWLPWLVAWTLGLALACWQGRGAVTAPAGIDALVLGGVWLLAVGVYAPARSRSAFRGAVWPEGLEGVLVALAVMVTWQVLPWLVPSDFRAPVFAAVAALLVVVSRRPGVKAALPASWVVGVMIVLASLWPAPEVRSTGVLAGYVIAALASWACAWGLARAPEPDEGPWWWRKAVPLQTGGALALSLVLAAVGWSGAGEIAMLVGVTSLAWAALRWGNLVAARVALVVSAIWTAVRALALVVVGQADGFSFGSAVVLAAAGLLALLPWWVESGDQPPDRAQRRSLSWLTGAGALGLIYFAMAWQVGVLAPYVTVGWGIAAIGLFVGGLFVRWRPYRLLGLAGLLVCIPRVFFVDLQSAFYRIIAFVVLGVVLLWVGFSYHRFRHLVVDTEDDAS